MKPATDYETMDWDAEAKRVARAFGTRPPVQFAPLYDDSAALFRCLLTISDEPSMYIPISPVLSILVSYHSPAQFAHGRKYFQVHRTGTMIEGHSMASENIELNWDGSVSADHLSLHQTKSSFRDDRRWHNHRYNCVLSRGLFHLNYLTPEVESLLGVSISHHQRMEWTLKYEEHYGL